MIEDPSRGLQEDVAALLSPVLEEDGFVLGGSAALREHGLIDRPTEDVDLFTLRARRRHFNRAVDTAVRTLEQHHYTVETLIGPELQPYARLHIEKDGIGTDMDFAIMPRHYAPTQSKLGWIVALPDAVGSKAYVAAVRGSARDFLDIVAIHDSGLFTDQQIHEWAVQYASRYEPADLVDRLETMSRLPYDRFEQYASRDDALKAQEHARQWARQLRTELGMQPPTPGAEPAGI